MELFGQRLHDITSISICRSDRPCMKAGLSYYDYAPIQSE